MDDFLMKFGSFVDSGGVDAPIRLQKSTKSRHMSKGPLILDQSYGDEESEDRYTLREQTFTNNNKPNQNYTKYKSVKHGKLSSSYEAVEIE